MESKRLILDERIRISKALALSDRTPLHLSAYGQAIMDRWDFLAIPTDGEAAATAC